jgi:hypothetical protein
MHERSSHRPHIAKPLYHNARPLYRHLLQGASFLHTVHHPSTGSLPPPQGPTDDDGLAGDHARHGIANLHAVSIHDPGHGLFVGIDIRGEDVNLWADD